MTSLEVLRPGLRTMVQDLGRPGLAHLGISGSGAWDRAAMRVANELVGNDPRAAVLEVVLGQVSLRCTDGDALLAVTGAPCPVDVDGRAVDCFVPLVVRDGQTITLGAPVHGLRTMVAVRGGIDVETVFDSRSSDPTRGMGPAVVAAGDVLAVGSNGTRTVRTSLIGADMGLDEGPLVEGPLVLHGVWGPRDDWFTPAAHEHFTSASWTVTGQADRVGVRLSGDPLERLVTGELASEAVVRGSVQVPTSGEPLVFGPDHPTTGGYPVIAVVDGPDADRLSQAAPGRPVHFVMRRVSLSLQPPIGHR